MFILSVHNLHSANERMKMKTCKLSTEWITTYETFLFVFIRVHMQSWLNLLNKWKVFVDYAWFGWKSHQSIKSDNRVYWNYFQFHPHCFLNSNAISLFFVCNNEWWNSFWSSACIGAVCIFKLCTHVRESIDIYTVSFIDRQLKEVLNIKRG